MSTKYEKHKEKQPWEIQKDILLKRPARTQTKTAVNGPLRASSETRPGDFNIWYGKRCGDRGKR